MIKTKTTSEFFKNDKPTWAVYDALRKLPNFIDGLKISQRKLIWTGFSKAAKDFVKTETFCNITALDTAYIHGSSNLCGVCASIVQDFVGTCNFPYFLGNDGGWGNRLVTRESAPRYTKLKVSDVSRILFNKTDCEILEKQFFEGQYIEPRTLMPVFPTIFFNSSSGLTAGFSSTIYSRNPDDVIQYIKKRLAGTENPRIELKPWFRKFKGEVRLNQDTGVYESVGVIQRNSMTSYTITEIPVETSYQKYIEFLNKLEDDGVIQDYDDRCNPRNNDMHFEIKTSRDFTRKHEDLESLYKAFRLVQTLPEQYNCIDEDNRVREFKSVKEILDAFIDIRLKYYQKRKDFILATFKSEIERLVSKYVFCRGIIDKTIKVANVKKKTVEEQLEKTKNVIKVDGSFDYLLRIPIFQITNEEIEGLKQKIKDLKIQFGEAKGKTVNDMWLEDLKELQKKLRS